jgi:hypothetical protein
MDDILFNLLNLLTLFMTSFENVLKPLRGSSQRDVAQPTEFCRILETHNIRNAEERIELHATFAHKCDLIMYYPKIEFRGPTSFGPTSYPKINFCFPRVRRHLR